MNMDTLREVLDIVNQSVAAWEKERETHVSQSQYLRGAIDGLQAVAEKCSEVAKAQLEKEHAASKSQEEKEVASEISQSQSGRRGEQHRKPLRKKKARK